MIAGAVDKISIGRYVMTRLRAYIELVKFRLSMLVAFSSGFGYVLGHSGAFDWGHFLMFCLGAILMSGAAITINQILEREYDKIMTRTQNRPLPTGRVSETEGWLFAIVLLCTSLLLLKVYANYLTFTLSLLSFFLYSFVYTPLKRVGSIAVFVGAIPGALPPLLGWVAATGEISYEALVIFGIQFIWQFPHFWAIAWIADEDYKKAGFKLLPFGGKKDMKTAINIMIYTLFLLPFGLFRVIGFRPAERCPHLVLSTPDRFVWQSGDGHYGF